MIHPLLHIRPVGRERLNYFIPSRRKMQAKTEKSLQAV
jgi:hypothetical protein